MRIRVLTTTGIALAALIAAAAPSTEATPRRVPTGAFELAIRSPAEITPQAAVGEAVPLEAVFRAPPWLTPQSQVRLYLFPHQAQLAGEGAESAEDPADSASYGGLVFAIDPGELQPGNEHAVAFTAAAESWRGPGVRARLFIDGREDNAWLDLTLELPAEERQ